MLKMKALRSFGVAGVNEGKVRRGREFSVANERRARELEDHGLAYRLQAKAEPRAANMIDEVPKNKASAAGPLDSPGGATGAGAPVPSSPPDRPRRGRRSKQSAEPAKAEDRPDGDLLS